MLKQYAAYFVAFLLNNLKDIKNIERIVLYGSVAKGEETKESDVDIFIEVKKKNKQLEKEIVNLETAFYNTRDASLFKLKGIQNKLNIKIGILKEWKDLYKSIASTGVVLYGYYEAKDLPPGLKHHVIIFWDNIGKNRGAFLNKIYGFRVKNKSYQSLLDKFNGKKLGKSCIMVPIWHKQEILTLIKKYQVSARIIEVFS